MTSNVEKIKNRLKSFVAGGLIALSNTSKKITNFNGNDDGTGEEQRAHQLNFDQQFVERHYQILEKAREIDLSRVERNQIFYFEDATGDIHYDGDNPLNKFVREVVSQFEYQKDENGNLIIGNDTSAPIILGEYAEYNGNIIYETNDITNENINDNLEFYVTNENGNPIPIGIMKTIINKLHGTENTDSTYTQKDVATIVDGIQGIEDFEIKLNNGIFDRILKVLTIVEASEEVILDCGASKLSDRDILRNLDANPNILTEISLTERGKFRKSKLYLTEFVMKDWRDDSGLKLVYKYRKEGEDGEA